MDPGRGGGGGHAGRDLRCQEREARERREHDAATALAAQQAEQAADTVEQLGELRRETVGLPPPRLQFTYRWIATNWAVLRPLLAAHAPVQARALADVLPALEG